MKKKGRIKTNVDFDERSEIDDQKSQTILEANKDLKYAKKAGFGTDLLDDDFSSSFSEVPDPFCGGICANSKCAADVPDYRGVHDASGNVYCDHKCRFAAKRQYLARKKVQIVK